MVLRTLSRQLWVSHLCCEAEKIQCGLARRQDGPSASPRNGSGDGVGIGAGGRGKHWATDEAFLKALRAADNRADRLMPTRLAGEGDRITNAGGFRRVGPVGASSTLAACVGFGVLFALLVMLRQWFGSYVELRTERGKSL